LLITILHQKSDKYFHKSPIFIVCFFTFSAGCFKHLTNFIIIIQKTQIRVFIVDKSICKYIQYFIFMSNLQLLILLSTCTTRYFKVNILQILQILFYFYLYIILKIGKIPHIFRAVNLSANYLCISMLYNYFIQFSSIC
jgi:hypothetical protein